MIHRSFPRACSTLAVLASAPAFAQITYLNDTRALTASFAVGNAIDDRSESPNVPFTAWPYDFSLFGEDSFGLGTASVGVTQESAFFPDRFSTSGSGSVFLNPTDTCASGAADSLFEITFRLGAPATFTAEYTLDADPEVNFAASFTVDQNGVFLVNSTANGSSQTRTAAGSLQAGDVRVQISYRDLQAFACSFTNLSRTGSYSLNFTLGPAAACTGDFNNDGFIDDDDFVVFAQQYNLFTVPPANAAADFDSSGFVDDTDFVIFAQSYDRFVCTP